MTGPDKLRAWREAEGLSQTEAADLVDVTQAAWCGWERGKKAPRVRHLAVLQGLTAGTKFAVDLLDFTDGTTFETQRTRNRRPSNGRRMRRRAARHVAA